MEQVLNRRLILLIGSSLFLSSCGIGNSPNIKDGEYKVEHCQMIEFGEEYEVITDDCDTLFRNVYDGDLDEKK